MNNAPVALDFYRDRPGLDITFQAPNKEDSEFAVLGISALGTWFGIRDKKASEKPDAE